MVVMVEQGCQEEHLAMLAKIRRQVADPQPPVRCAICLAVPASHPPALREGCGVGELVSPRFRQDSVRIVCWMKVQIEDKVAVISRACGAQADRLAKGAD